MFAPTALRFPPTTTLIIPYNVAVSFDPLDFVRVPMDANTVEVAFDFGDGTTASVSGVRGSISPVSKIYASPGRYTLRIQIRLDTNLWERYSWPVQVAVAAAAFAPGANGLTFLAAVQATLELPGGRRNLFVPLPAASSYSYGSSGYRHGSVTTPPSSDEFVAGLNAMARTFQQAYALGYGRVPVPKMATERAVYTHLPSDVIAYGTSSCLQSDLSILESALRDVLLGASRTDAMASVKTSVDALSALYADIRPLGRMTITTGNVLLAGDRSIQLGDVEAWHAFATTSVGEQTEFVNLTTREWRQLNQEFDRALPRPDMASAWYWEIAQAVGQTIDSMYRAMNRQDDAHRARAFLLAGVDDRFYSLRIYDDELQFWAQVSVKPGAVDSHVTLAEMGNERPSNPPPDHATHVAVRSVGALGVESGPCADLAYLFDARRIEASLQGGLFARFPSFKTMPSNIVSADDVATEPTGRGVLVDGTVVIAAASSSAWATTVGRPAMELPTGKETWGALTPHALLAIFTRGKAG
jgi:hypothetical protein